MKESILYLCTQEEPSVLKVLSSRYSVYVYRIGTDKELEKQQWKLVIFQDADVWQQRFFQKLKKFPWLFISTRADIRGYITPMPNLFGVVNMGGANLSLWGIPEEMQLRLKKPVEKVSDYYFFEQQPETCQIVYCPTGDSVQENDFKLLSFLQTTNTVLTIVSDKYQAIANAYPGIIKVVPQKSWFSAFKKAHLVVASGHNAICAMALCKPCIIVGDCGLGGIVTPTNYEQLQSSSFTGRKGASAGEIIPKDLLKAEICKVLDNNNKDVLQIIQGKILASYSLQAFSVILHKEIERIIDLSTIIKSSKKRFSLKPLLPYIYRQKESESKLLTCGLLRLKGVDEDMHDILEQCNGLISIQELTKQNGLDKEDTTILWENLQELWKEKLILFEL